MDKTREISKSDLVNRFNTENEGEAELLEPGFRKQIVEGFHGEVENT